MKYVLKTMLICLLFMSHPAYSETLLLITSPGEAFTGYSCDVLEYDHDKGELKTIFTVDPKVTIGDLQISCDSRILAIWRYTNSVPQFDVRESTGELFYIDLLNIKDSQVASIPFAPVTGGHLFWSEKSGWDIVTAGYWPHDIDPIITRGKDNHSESINGVEVPWHQVTDRGRFITKTHGETTTVYGGLARFKVDVQSGHLVHFIGRGYDFHQTSIPCDQIPEAYLAARNPDEGLLVWADKDLMCIEFELIDGNTRTQKEALIYDKTNRSWNTHTRPGPSEADYKISLLDGFLVYQQVTSTVNDDARGTVYVSTGRYELRTRHDEILCEWDIDPFSAPLAISEMYLYYRSGKGLHRIERKDNAKSELMLEDNRLDMVCWGAVKN